VTSGVAALRSIVQEVLMPKREVDAYRAQLETQLAALVGQGAATVHHMVENGDGIPDPNDRATREEDRNWSLRLRDRDRRLIGKIEEALARIESGTFGTCESCGQDISAERLRARPVTTLCIHCKTAAERRERVPRSR
jgi:DnaK suppressor protein